MNVLHINQSDISGGAAIAGYRLHQGLLAQGIDSRLLVGQVETSSDRVAFLQRNEWIEKRLWSLTWRLGLNYLNHVNSFDIPKHNLGASTFGRNTGRLEIAAIQTRPAYAGL